ncbi:MAG TPA: RagB/SusD family nutrient uptake outer membrane protein [Parasegetibacter sp.]
MKKLNFLYILFAAVAAFTLSSCKRELGALPTQARVEGAVVTDQKSAEVALNGAYARLANATAASTGWHYIFEIFPSQLSGLMQYAFGRTIENTNLMAPTGSASYWTPNFSILNAANAVIEEVSELDDSKFSGTRKAEILGEAHFIRAYAHFQLLWMFSEWFDINSDKGVLIRNEPLRLSNASKKRSTVKESYEHILADLDFAIANARTVRPNHYASKAAAKALKMRVLLLRGQGSDYNDVITIADDIIANTGGTSYALEPKLRDLFQSKGLSSSEVILGIYPQPSQDGKFRAYQFVQSGVYLTTNEFVQLLNGDPRSTWMYSRVGDVHNHATMAGLNKLDSFYLTKYYGPAVEVAYAIRLTEVYLMKAEAIIRSGGTVANARNVLRTVLERAEVTDFTAIDNATTPDQMLIEIYKEFSRNFVSENGMDYLALVRLPFNTVKQLRPTITERFQIILPIPATEFQMNPAIGEQNTGYSKT